MRRWFTGRNVRRLRLACATLALFVVLVFAFGSLATFGSDGPVTNPTDFRAFYCSGDAFGRGENPYRYGVERRCASRVLAQSGLRADDRHVLFAPLPPYALIPFAAFAKLPFRLATSCWLAASLMATGAIVVLVADATRTRPTLVALAFVASLAFASLVIGQLVPIALLGLVFAAWSLRRNDRIGVALGALVGALEPHLAAPVWLALLALAPRTRLPLMCAGAALLVVSVPFGTLDYEYVTSMIPAHARSEVHNSTAQYSLSTLLVSLGTPIVIAMRLGSLSYLVMAILGIALAHALFIRTRELGFIVVTPLAAVLLGGPFVHGHQMAAALPLGFFLATHLRTRPGLRLGTIAAIAVLAIPWQSVAESPFFADRAGSRESVVATSSSLVPRDDESAEIPYTAFIDAYGPLLDRRTIAERIAWKVPTWVALVTLLAIAYRLSRPSFERRLRSVTIR